MMLHDIINHYIKLIAETVGMLHTHRKQKISTQAYPEKWAAIKQIAEEEGRYADAVLDDAITAYLENKQNMRPRDSVMDAYNSSHKKYDELYRLLAQ